MTLEGLVGLHADHGLMSCAISDVVEDSISQLNLDLTVAYTQLRTFKENWLSFVYFALQIFKTGMTSSQRTRTKVLSHLTQVPFLKGMIWLSHLIWTLSRLLGCALLHLLYCKYI